MEALIRKGTSHGKPRIGLDLDGVVFGSVHRVLDVVAKKNGVRIEYEKLKSYAIHDHIPGSTSKQISEIFSWLWKHRSEKIRMMDPSIPRIVKALQHHFEINITTQAAGGDMEVFPNIVRILRNNGIPYDRLFHVNSIKEKTELGFEIYIEDNYNMLKHIGKTQHLILMPQPWVIEYVRRNQHMGTGRRFISDPSPSELRRYNDSLYGENAEGMTILPGGDLKTAWLNINRLMLQGLRRHGA